MRDADTRRYRQALLEAGIAPRHARRAIAELEDHFHDICRAQANAGSDWDEACDLALRRLGEPGDIAAMMGARRELNCWYRRWPRLASGAYATACVLAVPLLPVVASTRHAGTIGRWSACLLLSAGFTASLLLAMQLSIRFS